MIPWDNLKVDSGEVENQQMQFIERRGIPGVTSDEYHLGYFESSSSYKSRPPVHTKFDPLYETLCFFGVLIFGALIVTCITFGIREYTYSMRRRNRLFSAGSEWSINTAITIPEFSNSMIQSAILGPQGNHIYPNLLKNQQTNQSHLFSPSANSEVDETLFTDARETAKGLEGPSDFTPLEVVQQSPNYSSKSLEGFFSDNDLLKTSNVAKKIYSIKELFSLKPEDYHGRPLTKDGPVELTTLAKAVSLSIPLQTVSFQSAWTAEKTLLEICLYLTNEMIPPQPVNDNATKKIAVLRFLAIAANCSSLQNPNIFLSPLNRVMDALIDSGIIFEILNDSSPYISRSLIEVLLQYCFAHWHFPAREKNDHIIHKQFAKWKMNSPAVQPHHVLFRYLINLELGLYSVDNLDSAMLKAIESRIITLLIHLTGNADCNDYLGFIPILSQAIEFTERTYCQTLCYDLLHILVQKHSDCCMEEYLKDDKSDLKRIIQCGFWIKNDRLIRKFTERIHVIVLSKNPEAMSWWKEINGGRIYISPSPRELDLKCDTSDIRNSQRSITPGSWVNDRKPKTPVW